MEQRALASSAVRLQALLDLKATTALPTLAADVIAGNANPNIASITIDRGSADGVQENRAVIAPGGIVSSVTRMPRYVVPQIKQTAIQAK